MKKGIVVFLVFLTVLTMAACGGPGAVPGPEADGPVGEEAALERIAVSPPEGWEAYDTVGMLYSYRKGAAAFLMKEEAYFTVDSLDMVVRKAQDILTGAFDNVEYEGEPAAVTVGGLDASRFYFTCDSGGLTMKYEYVYFIAGGDIYAVIFSDLGDSFDANAADFDAILDSIVIS